MAPAISFSGRGERGPMWLLIKHGKKTQTVRKPRKRPIKKGYMIKLYWKQRTPRIKKLVHLIADAEVVKVQRMKYRDFAHDDKFARKDGFVNSAELRSWFGSVRLHGEDPYDVIEFVIRRLHV